MNIRFSYVVSLIEILLMSVPTPMITTQLAFADNPSGVVPSRVPDASPTVNGKCDTTCSTVEAQTSDEAMDIACPKSTPASNPLASPSPVPIENNNLVFNNRDDCISYMRAQWGEVYTHCKAKKLNEIGRNYDIASASVFVATAAVCLYACALLNNVVTGPMAVAAQAACTVGGIAGEAVDIAGMIHLSVEGQSGSEWINESFGFSALGPGALGVVAGGASNIASYKQAKNAAKAGGKEAGKTVISGGLKNLKNTFEGGTACIAGALFFVSGALKFGGVAIHETNRQKECSRVEELEAIGQGTALVSTPFVPIDNYQVGQGTGAGQAAGGSTGKASTPGSSVDSLLNNGSGDFPPAQTAAATSGAGGQLLSNMPNKSKIPEVLDQLGTSLDQIGKQLAAGASPSSILSDTVPNMSQNMKDQMANFEKLLKEGKVTGDDVPGLGPYSSGGQAKSSSESKENPFLAALKNRTSFGGSSSTQQVSFSGKELNRAPASTGTDIWHANWNGTIFQLISVKIDQTKGRVEQLEWATPLNRALSGLSNVKPAEKKDGSK